MRKLCLVRHAQPAFPTEERYCIGGRTDWPLSETGRAECRKMAAELLPVLEEEWKNGRKTEIWSSPMLRAVQTAEYLCVPGTVPRTRAGLEEMDAGVWDGLSFSEIRKRYPEAYEARKGLQGMALIPGAETDEHGLERFTCAVGEILKESDAETVVIVAHATVIQLYLCRMAGRPLADAREFKPPYCGISVIELPENGTGGIGGTGTA